MPRSPFLALFALVALGALLYVRVRLVADPREALLEVRVQGAVAPAVVRVEGIGAGGRHEREADAQGIARFEGLAPGFYDITAVAGVRETAQAVRVRLSPGRRLVIDVQVVGSPVRR